MGLPADDGARSRTKHESDRSSSEVRLGARRVWSQATAARIRMLESGSACAQRSTAANQTLTGNVFEVFDLMDFQR